MGHPHGDESFAIVQRVVVNFLRTLRGDEERQAQSAAFAHDAVGPVQTLSGLRVHDLALGREVMDLVNDDEELAFIRVEERRREVEPETCELTWHPAAKSQDARTIAGGD
jgi:hypothetical protein